MIPVLALKVLSTNRAIRIINLWLIPGLISHGIKIQRTSP